MIKESMEEIWKDVVGYEGLYRVSNKGRIWSVKNNKFRKSVFLAGKERKYRYFKLAKNGKHKCLRACRLVAIAFLPNPKNYPIVNHIDGVRDNDRVENLEWCTYSMNLKHAYKIGLTTRTGKNNSMALLDEIKVLTIRTYGAANETPRNIAGPSAKLSDIYGVSKACVNSVLRGDRWKHLPNTNASEIEAEKSSCKTKNTN